MSDCHMGVTMRIENGDLIVELIEIDAEGGEWIKSSCYMPLRVIAKALRDAEAK
jgi:hypothetical protein